MNLPIIKRFSKPSVAGANKKNRKLVLALVGAAASTLLLFNTMAPAANDTVSVLEVASPVAKNQQIKDTDVVVKTISKSTFASWMVTDKTQVVGKYAAVDLYAGDKVRSERVSTKEVQDFKENERSMNIPVELTNMGGQPKAGDLVDIIAYLPPAQKGVGMGHSELVLQNVLVENLFTKEGKDATQNPTGQAKDAPIPAIVTVKVSVQNSLLLHTFVNSDAHTLRLITRHDNSKDVDIKAPVADGMKAASTPAQPAPTTALPTQNKAPETNAAQPTQNKVPEANAAQTAQQ